MKHLVVLGLVLCLGAAAAVAAEQPKFELKDGDRVAFIGDTFVEREQADCYIETMLTSRFPDRNVTFRNLGYSGDTVTGSARGLCTGWATFESSDKAFDRLRKLVAEFKPTVLLMNYGMTESFTGPEGVPTFTENYNKMLDALSKAAGTSPRIVLMSPNYHEDLGRPLPDPTEHNKNLKLYSEAIAKIAEDRNCQFIDLFSMTKAIDESPSKPLITTNGIHLTQFGYWLVAFKLKEHVGAAASVFSHSLHTDKLGMDCRYCHEPVEKTAAPVINRMQTCMNCHSKTKTSAKDVRNASGEISIQAADVSSENGSDLQLMDLKKASNAIRFTITRKTLPLPPTPGGVGAGPKNGPMTFGHILKVSGLADGQYELKAGEKVIVTANSAEWGKGVDFDCAGPDVEQAEALRKAIVAKNFEFFAYQRPDNDAYILAFRRGEQGKNAVEIPRFLPLVAEKEKQIAELRVPKPVTYTLEAVK